MIRPKKKRTTGPRRVFAQQYDRHVDCPWCKSTDTYVVSPFGGTVSEVSFMCRECNSAFGWMKWEHKAPADLLDKN
jgi:transcription elongation factor Elf1